MSSDKTNAYAALGGCGLVIVLVVVSSILNGVVFSQLWAWFVVPTFGAPALSVPAAIGLAMVAAMLTSRATNEDSNDKRSALEKLIAGTIKLILSPLLTLFMGFIVKGFM